MNDIKKKLIMASENQKINDLSSKIIDKVDTSRVIIKPKAQKKKIPYYFIGKLAIFSAGVAGILMLGISFGKINDKNNNNIGIEESQFDIDEVTLNTYLDKIETQETYNIVNIAHAIENINIFDVEEGLDKNLTKSQEEALVNDINQYIYNIEDMRGLTPKVECISTNNLDINYNYSDKITINSPYYSYNLYITERIIEESNVGEATYKSNSIIEGVIVIGEKEYSIIGTKIIKNGTIEYTNKIIIDNDNYINVKELFKEKLNDKDNEFTYEYHIGNKTKTITVTQKRDLDGNTTKIHFDNGYNKIEDIYNNEENYLACKIKSSNSDILYINKNLDTFSYKFKNSGNEYNI